MKTNNLIILIAVFSVSLHTCLQAETVELGTAAIANLKLEYSQVTAQSIQHSLQAAGSVKLNEKRVIEVTPKISGMIVTDPRSIGDVVQKGDSLGKLQSPILSEMLTTYVAAEEAMTFAVAAVEQERKLEAQKLSSAEQLREKELSLAQAMTAHVKALQPLKLLEFNEGTIHVFLANIAGTDFTTLDLTASESGEIIGKEVRRGAAVEGDQTLFTIADLSQLWVDFYVPLREVSLLSKGETVRVNSTVSDSHRDAEIIYVSPVADEKSRTVLMRAVLMNEDKAWRPGTPVSVSSLSGGAKGSKVISVPSSALVDYEGGKAVFVKEGDTSFLPTPVKVGASDGSMTEIVEGLTEGMFVVSRNAAQLKGHLEMTAGE